MPTDIIMQASVPLGAQAGHSSSGQPKPAPAILKGSGASAVDGRTKPAGDKPAVELRRPSQEPPNREQLQEAVDRLARHMQNTNLNFSIDDGTGQTVVKIIDSENDEVIRQIPSEEMLALAVRLQELQGEPEAGLLLQSEA